MGLRQRRRPGEPTWEKVKSKSMGWNTEARMEGPGGGQGVNGGYWSLPSREKTSP